MNSSAPARTVPNVSNPLGFFTTVADKMLRSTFSFGVTNIPVYSNGVFVYTPAVQRLLQLSANIYDAANTNWFPVVFRPLFANDTAGNLFIMGYQQVTNVTGPTDPQLSTPYDVTQLSAATTTPIAGIQGPVNVYGVPWIIGAKKGLPAFSQLYLSNTVQISCKLMFNRPAVGALLSTFTTNQMFTISANTGLGISFWNPYNAAYPRPLTLYASDAVFTTLVVTNSSYPYYFSHVTNLFIGYPGGVVINPWLGSQWLGSPPYAIPFNQTNGFVYANWSFNFLNPSVYRFNTHSFDPVGSPTSSAFETTTPPLPPLDPMVLAMTNYLQAFILDGSSVIDYVQLGDPNTVGNLNRSMTDPNYPDITQTRYQWSTNAYPASNSANNPTYGLINQFTVSRSPSYAPIAGGQWVSPSSFLPPAMLIGLNANQVPAAEAAFFSAFFIPTSNGQFQYGGKLFFNTNLAIQAPYTPLRTIFSGFLLQANDPLVHYLASDLNAQTGAKAIWGNGSTWENGVWLHVDDPQNQPMPIAPLNHIGGRYQPWGQYGLMAEQFDVDTNAYNLGYKDPLIWWPDSWTFPTNLLQSLGDLGQVHRGTPWQTFYLKSSNVLAETIVGNGGSQNIGTNTWMAWTGDIDPNDAALMAPDSDWRLAGLLMSVLNTNDATQLFSVNDPNIADWQNLFNGLTVYSNTAFGYIGDPAPTFDMYIMTSNSPQALFVANGISNVKVGQPNQAFYSIGDIFAVPELSVNSPWLSHVDNQDDISDAVYEAIPAQLLPLLRPDSFGALLPTNGGWNLSFSGADGYSYVLQSSTNLTNWSSISTNSPVQGMFTVPISPGFNKQNYFYRSVLFP